MVTDCEIDTEVMQGEPRLPVIRPVTAKTMIGKKRAHLLLKRRLRLFCLGRCSQTGCMANEKGRGKTKEKVPNDHHGVSKIGSRDLERLLGHFGRGREAIDELGIGSRQFGNGFLTQLQE